MGTAGTTVEAIAARKAEQVLSACAKVRASARSAGLANRKSPRPFARSTAMRRIPVGSMSGSINPAPHRLGDARPQGGVPGRGLVPRSARVQPPELAGSSSITPTEKA
jgi:hypothetical protein